jgi:hypothetical protein
MTKFREFTFFGLMPFLLIGCANSSRILDKFEGEQLITPYYADIKDWQFNERKGPGFSERVWQSPNSAGKDGYAVSANYSQTTSLTQMRDSADIAGVEACDKFASKELRFPNESLYPLLFWETECRNRNGFRAKVLHLMIDGSEATYHLQKSWQIEFTKEDVQAWRERFESVFLCDNRLVPDSCPEIKLR